MQSEKVAITTLLSADGAQLQITNTLWKMSITEKMQLLEVKLNNFFFIRNE